MRLCGDAEGSGWVVVIPGVPSYQDVRRVGGHGRELGVLRSRDRSASGVRFEL